MIRSIMIFFILILLLYHLISKRTISYTISGGLLKDKKDHPHEYWISIVFLSVLLLFLLFEYFKDELY